MDKTTKKVLVGASVVTAGLLIWKLSRKGTISMQMFDPNGNPIPKRLTSEMVAAIKARAAAGRIGAWTATDGEGVAHLINAAITNTTKKGTVPAPATFTATLTVESPIGTPLGVTPGTITISMGSAATSVYGWSFTPVYGANVTTSQPGRAICTVTAIDGSIFTASYDFMINVIQTVYGASIVLTEG